MSAFDSLLGFSTPVEAVFALPESRIGFRIHATLPRLVLPAGMSSQLALDPVLAPVPNTKSWLRGVLNARGNLVPVFDIGLWHGLEAQPVSAHVLVVSAGGAAMAVTCCEQPSLLAVRPVGAVSVDDPMAVFSAILFVAQEGSIYEFDPHAWLRRVGGQVPGRAKSI